MDILKEMCRVLKDGGKLYIVDYERGNELIKNLVFSIFMQIFEPKHMPQFLNYNWGKILRSVGFQVNDIEKQQIHQIPFSRGDSHMPVGWGSIPVCDIFSIFMLNYDGMFIMELRNRYFKHIRESRENLLSVLQKIDAHQKDDTLTLNFSQPAVAL